MNISLVSANIRRNQNGHHKNKLKWQRKVIVITRITTHGIIVTIVENMDISLRIIIGHFLEEITRNG